MNVLSLEEKTKVIQCLVEGNSIRGTVRITGTAKGTILRLLEDVGKACAKYQDEHLRNLSCKRIECDEIWSFCGIKEKNLSLRDQGKFGIGSVWTWTAIDSDTRLVPCWFVGQRTLPHAKAFITNLKSRLTNRVELITDGLSHYAIAIESIFGGEIDYAMIVKKFGEREDMLLLEKQVIQGNPDPTRISTSYVERQNLTMRTQMKRFTRKTNAFSKKIENLQYAIALHFMYYNFCRPHTTLNKEKNLGVTPAMAAGVAKRPWKIEEIVRLIASH
jgi:IS1 family transposase